MFSAILTPVIAIVTTFIMIQQYRIEKRNSKYQLYQHRHAIYETTMTFIAAVVHEGRVEREELRIFMVGSRDSIIFFKDDINDYLKDLYKKAIRLQYCEKKMKHLPVGEERSAYVDEDFELMTFFSNQHEECKLRFLTYLNFKKP